jgi:glyoxylase-like metal-dependent hydrolase (beta-lactamase superfamily II)
MANFCYLVGDEASKTCALIDPAFETDHFLLNCKGAFYASSPD